MATLPDVHNLRKKFPAVAEFQYTKTSEKSGFYNCIAWAAGESDRHWWPRIIHSADTYWPLELIEDEATIDKFIKAFETLRYEEFDNGSLEKNGTLEEGIEKVAIYVKGNRVTHMARQLINGDWTTKDGTDGIDFSHHLRALEDSEKHGESLHGKVVKYLRRSRCL